MKALHIIRHAKSSWKQVDLADIERPLSSRGKVDTLIMATEIRKSGCQFQSVYSSPAKRAKKTIKRIYNALDLDPHEIKFDPALYTSNVKFIVEWLKNRNHSESEIVIVGHNPTLTELVSYLTQHNPAELGNLPTCAYIKLEVNVESWKDLYSGSARIKMFLYPKLFK